MAFEDWSTNEAANATTAGVNIGENCPRANVNNWGRAIMAQLRSAFSQALSPFFSGSSPLPVANGGTGGASAEAARAGIGAAAAGANGDITSLSGLTTPLSVSRGGTGSVTASAALAALGGIGENAKLTSNPGYLRLSNGFIVQWGIGTVGGNDSASVSYLLNYNDLGVPVVSGGVVDGGAQDNFPAVVAADNNGFTVFNARDTFSPFWWIAVGF